MSMTDFNPDCRPTAAEALSLVMSDSHNMLCAPVILLCKQKQILTKLAGVQFCSHRGVMCSLQPEMHCS